MLIRSLGWLMVLAVSLVAVACDTTDASTGKAKAIAGPTTTAAPIDPAAHPTTTTIPFSTEIAAARSALDKAGNDFCALIAVTHQELHITPLTTDEVKQAVDLLVDMIEDMGAVMPPDAAVYQSTAAKLRAAAEKSNYDPVWMQNGKTWNVLNDKAFVAATSRLATKYQATCKPAS